MIERYTRPAMGGIWTDENKYRCWLQVEAAASTVLAEDGVIPLAAAEAIAAKATVSAARVAEIEAEVKHDVIAFTTAVAESLKSQGLDAESRWLHYGLTSNDIVDTAQALQVKEASALIKEGIAALLAVLRRRALEFKHTPTIGRTHGIHAEPTTFGLKLLNWFAEMERNATRFAAAAEDMRVGKLSGAVGTFGHLKPEQEEKVCERLGLKPAPVATQVIQRDRHAAYISTLAILGSTLDKIAVEVRHLQRTEVREAQEYFSEKQKGSSAMPHKKNPITAEQISGLARVLRRTRRTPSPANKSAAWRASFAAMRKPRLKIFRSGTSATSRIPRSSASSSQIPRFLPIICWPKPRTSSIASWSTPSG